MIIETEISLYPLRTKSLGSAIDDFIAHLKKAGLQIETGPMSSRITGELTEVFPALQEAFAAVADRSQSVLIIKASNACGSSASCEQTD